MGFGKISIQKCFFNPKKNYQVTTAERLYPSGVASYGSIEMHNTTKPAKKYSDISGESFNMLCFSTLFKLYLINWQCA